MDMNLSELAKQLGKQGGLKTKERYGNDHFKRLQILSTRAKKTKDKPNFKLS